MKEVLGDTPKPPGGEGPATPFPQSAIPDNSAQIVLMRADLYAILHLLFPTSRIARSAGRSLSILAGSERTYQP